MAHEVPPPPDITDRIRALRAAEGRPRRARVLRQLAGLTLHQLSDLTGINAGQISCVERGLGVRRVMKHLAAFYHVPVDTLHDLVDITPASAAKILAGR